MLRIDQTNTQFTESTPTVTEISFEMSDPVAGVSDTVF